MEFYMSAESVKKKKGHGWEEEWSQPCPKNWESTICPVAGGGGEQRSQVSEDNLAAIWFFSWLFRPWKNASASSVNYEYKHTKSGLMNVGRPSGR